MAIKDLKKILEQINEPNELTLIPFDLNHPIYYIWKSENTKLKDLDSNLRSIRKEDARFDIFINGQYVLNKDYVFEQVGNDFHIKFIKSNFPYVIDETDVIKVEGDIDNE